MKKKIIIAFLFLFLLFLVGILTTLHIIDKTTVNLTSLLSLHKVEVIRQDLVINVQTVQANLYTTGTSFGKELDTIVDNVLTLRSRAQTCTECHHADPAVEKEILNLLELTEQYKDALSYFITSTADPERVRRLQIFAAEIGDRIIDKSLWMTMTANDTLHQKTTAAMVEVAASRKILTLTLVFAFFVSVLISLYFLSSITGPIAQLLQATRKIRSGKLQYRIEEKLHDEFGHLAASFNEMAEALAHGQQILQENEARFRLLMDSIDALVYVADMETYEVLFINEFGIKEFGDITGRICWQNLQKGQSGPCSFCTNRYLLDEKGRPVGIYTWESRNTVTGQWYYIRDRAIEWVDGRIVRLQIATDISERKLAEIGLAEETERLAVTLRSIGDGVITTDTGGRVVLINQVAEGLTGWSSDEATGRPLVEVFSIIHEVTRKPCENPVEKVLAAGKIVEMANHTVLIAKNGQERSIADSGAPIKDKDGRILGVVLVFRDITAELRTEQELAKVKKMESIGVLAGGLAHDFNNILAAILGNIELSLLDAGLPLKTRQTLQEAVKATQRARGLTSQLLTFAKGGDPIKESASLVEVIRDSADFVLRGSKSACRYLFADDLWLVDIDRGQISQVVQNLILNASQAMPVGGVIEVSCENLASEDSASVGLPKKGDYVMMKIKDNGIGIPEDLLDKIFDPYFSTKQQGSGLGLAISHSIVNKHDGHIMVQSTPGIGTVFTVYLPASGQGSVPAAPAEEAAGRTKNARILIMDDEAMIRDVTKALLSKMGHEVLLAEEGAGAVRIYQEAMAGKTPIDLVIMDLTIPGGMGGKEAVQKILALDPLAKVIVSSGYSHDPIMANFNDYGFCSALAKPFAFSELSKIVNQFLMDS
jgi:PAS domain S-box-containing protein